MLNDQIKKIALAIRDVESGGNYNAKGASGENGAYQFMPGTWRAWANLYLGNPAAPMTEKNQNKVAYYRLKEWSDRGYTPPQMASLWNSGSPEWDNKIGINGKGVPYNVPDYVNKVINELEKKNKEDFENKYNNFNSKIDEKRLEGYTDTEILNNLSQRDSKLKRIIDLSRKKYGAEGSEIDDDRKLLNYMSETYSGQRPTVESVPEPDYEEMAEMLGYKWVGNDKEGWQLLPRREAERSKEYFESLKPYEKMEWYYKQVQEHFKEGIEGMHEAADYYNQTGNLKTSAFALGAEAAETLFKSAWDGVTFYWRLLPNLMTDPVEKAGENILQSDLAQEGLEQLAKGQEWFEKDFAKKHPVAAKNIVSGLKYASIYPAARGDVLVRALNKITRPFFRIGGKTIAFPLKQAKKAIKSTSKLGITKVGGINTATVDTILKYPRRFKVAMKSGLDRMTLGNKVARAINKKLSTLKSTGSAYGKIRSANPTIKPSIRKIKDTLKKYDIELSNNGKIKYTGESVRLSSSQKNYLKDLTDTYLTETKIIKGKPIKKLKNKMSAKEFLNARELLSDMGKFEIGVTKTDVGNTLARELRRTFNDFGKPQIKGLKKLDDMFRKERKEFENLYKEYINPKTNQLKDGALSRIAGATREGRQLILQRLEKLIPGITDEINILNAIDDVLRAKEQKVGAYFSDMVRAGAVGGSIMSGNPLAIAASLIFANPSSLVSMLRTYALITGWSKKTIEKILSKIMTGKKLTEKELQIIDDTINYYSDKFNKTIKRQFGKIKPGLSVEDITKGKITTRFLDYVKNKKFTNLAPKIETKVSKEFDSLFQEARKYKSADEFVEAKVDNDAFSIRQKLVEETPNVRNANDTIKLYHGTDIDNYNKILSSKQIGKKADDITFFTTSKKEAKQYAENKARYRGKKPAPVLELEVPKIEVRKGQMGEFANEYEVVGVLKFNDFYKNDLGMARHDNLGIVETFGGKTKSQLADIWKQAQKVKEVAPKNKKFLSKQEIKDYAKRPELKKGEADLINAKLKEFEGQKIPVQEFADSIRRDLLELKPVKVKEPQFENVSLGARQQGDITPKANYEEVVFESPITTDGSSHYPNSENYFAHARGDEVVENGKKIWREQEIQSDLLQKDRLEDLGFIRGDKIFYKGKEWSVTGRDTNNVDLVRGATKDRPFEQISVPKSEFERPQFTQLQPFTNDRYGERIMRERIKEKAIKGYDKYRLPTGETIGKIEGFEPSTWKIEEPSLTPATRMRDFRNLTAENMKVGIEVFDRGRTNWIITDTLGDGRFKAIPKREFELLRKERRLTEQGLGRLGVKSFDEIKKLSDEELAKRASNLVASETFDLTGKTNPQYRRYEKWGKFLKNKFDAKKITDPQGDTWFEVDIKPEYAEEPVQAFGQATIGNLIAGGAVIGATLAGTSLLKNKKEKPEKKDNLQTYRETSNVKAIPTIHTEKSPKKAKLTVYHSEEGQTDETPNIGGFMTKIEFGDVAIGNRDEYNEAKNKFLEKGEDTFIIIPELSDVQTPYGNGVFRIRDTMNKRFSGQNKIDIFIPPNMKGGNIEQKIRNYPLASYTYVSSSNKETKKRPANNDNIITG